MTAETPHQKIARLARRTNPNTGIHVGIAECGCPNKPDGTPPTTHICPQCGFESGYRLHHTCSGCFYNEEQTRNRRNH